MRIVRQVTGGFHSDEQSFLCPRSRDIYVFRDNRKTPTRLFYEVFFSLFVTADRYGVSGVLS